MPIVTYLNLYFSTLLWTDVDSMRPRQRPCLMSHDANSIPAPQGTLKTKDGFDAMETEGGVMEMHRPLTIHGKWS